VDETARRLVEAGDLPHPPSFFEVLTALAFLYFAAEGPGEAKPVDIAILEVGLGGRLDATNIVDPLLSVITDIALDHQDYLGDTIAEITREKAGILRRNGTLITLPQHPEANQAIGEAAAELSLRAISAANFIPHLPPRPSHPARPVTSPEPLSGVEPGSGEVRFSTANPDEPLSGSSPPLPRNHYAVILDGEPLEVDSPLYGQHQQRNIALAIAAADELRNLNGYKLDHDGTVRNYGGYKIGRSAIEEGIRNVRWPGRLELLSFPQGPSLLLDVAHNPAGAWTLRAAIAQLPEGQPRTLIFSCLRDKNLNEMSQILLPLFDSSADRPYDHIFFAPINNPRAAGLEELLAAAHALDIPAHAAPHLAAALAEARAVTPPNGLIIATGSVYLVGEIRQLAVQG
jgi:dihydrofolate synthase/folylpolyglutamate synthase